MSERNKDEIRLTPGAERLVEEALRKQRDAGHEALGTYHWLLALLERHGPMAEALAEGLEAAPLASYLRERLRDGLFGEPQYREQIVGAARERAMARGVAEATERDVASAILEAAGYQLRVQAGNPRSCEQPRDGEALGAAARRDSSAGPLRPTPALDQFGRDLTAEARQGRLGPVIGRENEIELVIETLCRRTKRNPALVGPAGVGKTAIVEGLAQRVARGEVPEALRGARIVALQPSNLTAGAHVAGEMEKRVKAILQEAAQDGLILFIDEMHSMVGAGGMVGLGDVASVIKPALARGQIACIGATTDDEYRRFIEPDAALERRFQPVRVQELTPAQTMLILPALRDLFVRMHGVYVSDDTLEWIVAFCQRYLRNRYFPDKAIDLLEQTVAHAVTKGHGTVTTADAEQVAQRMVGMPADVAAGLERLRQELAARALLAQDDAASLLTRLGVTMRGLDLRPARPNLVVLLAGEVAANSTALAEVIASSLFGAAERVVTIDLGRMVHAADVSILVGAPPGYVGYSDALPLHRVAQMPWCVLCLQNVDACHPEARTVVTQMLANGYITDGRGKRIYLSDTIVLLTAGSIREEGTPRAIGFGLPGPEAESTGSAPAMRRVAAEVLGARLVDETDLICSALPASDALERRWLKDSLLADLTERYRREGLRLTWDESIIDWLLAQRSEAGSQRDWERLVDEHISPLLVGHLAQGSAKEVKSVLIKVQGGTVCVESCGG